MIGAALLLEEGRKLLAIPMSIVDSCDNIGGSARVFERLNPELERPQRRAVRLDRSGPARVQ